MSPERDRPRAYLLEADYYRLAYQLAAQRANRAEVRNGDLGEPLDHHAVEDATELSESVQSTLDYFQGVAEASIFPWHRRLSLKERRLQRFLMSTVRPSVELVVAGLELRHRPAMADERVRELLARRGAVAVDWTGALRWSEVTVVPWSYRAYYNLACYASTHDRLRRETWRGWSDDLLRASGRDSGAARNTRLPVRLWALQQAFRIARDRERREIVRWAHDDPSLELLRSGEDSVAEYVKLRNRYNPPAAAKPVYEIGEWSRADDDAERWLGDRVIRELTADRPGYAAIRYPVMQAAKPTRRLFLDALLQAEAEDAADVVIDVWPLQAVDLRQVPTLSDRALGLVARYAAITGRPAKVWLVVVVAEGETLPLEERLNADLANYGVATVLTEAEMPALRRLPLPT
jgi:hypothetical protein